MSFLAGVQRVVVPVDLENATSDALAAALEVAGDDKNVHVIYVLPELEPSLVVTVSDASRLTHAREAMRQWLAERAFPQGVRTHVRIGRAEQHIVELCEAIDAQLVVLHSKGRTGIRRALLGSVAERVARMAPCPVLLLKDPVA